METIAAPTQDLTSQKEFMSLADAVANCQVKAKKTIVRWAKMEGIRERYGRTGTSNLERVVPVDWVRAKMESREIFGEPIFEPVELIENVSFTRQETTSPLGPKVPALFRENDAPQLLVFFDRIRKSQEAQAVEVRKLIHESRLGNELIGRAIQESREEGRKESGRFRRFQSVVNVGLCAGVLLLGVGLGFVIHLGFQLNASRTMESKSLKRELAGKLVAQEKNIRSEIQGVKLSQRQILSNEELRSRELSQLRDGIRVLREDLLRREDVIVGLFRTKDEELTAVKAQLQALMDEKEELATATDPAGDEASPPTKD